MWHIDRERPRDIPVRALVSEPTSLVRDTLVEVLALKEEQHREASRAAKAWEREQGVKERRKLLVKSYLEAKFPNAVKEYCSDGNGDIAVRVDIEEIERIIPHAEKWARREFWLRLGITGLLAAVGGSCTLKVALLAYAAVSGDLMTGAAILLGFITGLATLAVFFGACLPALEVLLTGYSDDK
ncbi:MAG: hypothetical protein A3I44_02280 [Candidatus Sungbacteria bacterium RIFCSPLOWO2_02_FULL_51_17]|uniref:Uncharacterized protein n=1 Tax=Candidatus Sungbacteria bacterium RIFCSPHIGHO2_02_FULL_51_29 TaxID=1802273 RepID=A0A1G2KXG7_9BACT|nr:MAG: hypothetical protein A2676_01955 [Candidatus Sungbacteria bacterium RIFCSPHIGHO2_01_FULL_51_22]OHA04107.1 MAG: hypothetical protein A3C16_02155 [Candidatus Sungbacteria bacterium RIFCSPHIGHO2_02_FULL_51_29]OHA04759.1 MAG: hypothetical protein A3B29_01475 [Candidatus Sungbacteria bacterium RIFCSPLOWO2_01_FULL_51_34]OHA12021.1 MAG: hypothetical protein A3I44_02280 [Candidatus Sungbacteria bacterium RIFCSPLOWO2_02_FULL_51_17]